MAVVLGQETRLPAHTMTSPPVTDATDGVAAAAWAMLAALGNPDAIHHFWVLTDELAPRVHPPRDRQVGESGLVYTNRFRPGVSVRVIGTVLDDQVLGRTPANRYTVHTAAAIGIDGKVGRITDNWIGGYFPTAQTACDRLADIHASAVAGRIMWDWD